MNPLNILKLFTGGGNVFSTLATVLMMASAFIAGKDADNKGTDDAIAQIMASAGEGLNAYGQKNYNKAGNVIDAVIRALENLRQTWIDSGLIKQKPPLQVVPPPGDAA